MGENGRWLCEIKEAEEKGDSIREAIPERDYQFWLTQCVPYPDPEDSAHCPPRHKLPERCSFTILGDIASRTHFRMGECNHCGECCRRIAINRLKDGICRYAHRME